MHPFTVVLRLHSAMNVIEWDLGGSVASNDEVESSDAASPVTTFCLFSDSSATGLLFPKPDTAVETVVKQEETVAASGNDTISGHVRHISNTPNEEFYLERLLDAIRRRR